MKRIVALLLVFGLLLAGCGGGTAETDVHKSPSKVPVVETDTMDFAVNLFRAAAKEGENTLVSPLSVLTALAMAANGAEGDSLTQMETTLGGTREDLNDWLGGFRDDDQLKQANGIWVKSDQKFDPNEDFLTTVQKVYDAVLNEAPFDETTRDEINDWVREETEGMIDGIIDQIPQEAIMYLINALSFEAAWENPYEEHQVQEGVFTTEDGRELDAEMMYGTAYDYLRTENATGFRQWYEGEDYAFVALLPNEGVTVAELVDSLTGKELSQLLEKPEVDVVQTAIPKFEAESDFELSEVLRDMGMDKVFDDTLANFSGLGTYESRNIYISRVLHKTSIQLAEQGTKAGAATAVEIAYATGAFGPAEEPTTVYLDRPFVYMIVERDSGIPLFMGTCLEP